MLLKTSALSSAIALFAGAFGFSAPASAQATRTWISGVGDDANPCSRTAPCRSFSGAITKTAAGGELNCLDAGAFGPATISKSISIICDDVYAGTDNGSGTSFTIGNMAPEDVVSISGVDFSSAQGSGFGIQFHGAGTLIVKNSLFGRYNGGFGIFFSASNGPSRLVLDDVTFVDNQYGLLLSTTNSDLSFSISNSSFSGNKYGFVVNHAYDQSSARIEGSISTTRFVGRKTESYGALIFGPFPDASGNTSVSINDGLFTGIATTAISAQQKTSVGVSGTQITNSGRALETIWTARLSSFGDNILAGNSVNGSFSGSGQKK